MTTSFTVSAVVDAVASAIPDREYLIQGSHRFTYRDTAERSRRLAGYLHSRGLGCHTERCELANHQVGQDLLGIYAYNGNEYVEAMLAAFRARVAPFNVNYRYVSDELRYLLTDSGATALVYHSAFAPALAGLLPDLPQLRILIQIADDSGNELLPGAVDYETIVAEASPVAVVDTDVTPDDLYVLYTGGTTGHPKGVLWRQHDIFVSAFGGRNFLTGEIAQSCEQLAEAAAANPGTKMLVLPPLMHGAAQWSAMTAFTTGQTVVFPTSVQSMDADEVVRLIEEEMVLSVTAVGDAMARPFLDAVGRSDADLSSLAVWANGGAALTPAVKQRLLARWPSLLVVDGVGSSETGQQMKQLTTVDTQASNTFQPGPDTCVVAEDLTSLLEPGHDCNGWLAQRGCVPLGYKDDAVKSAASFPVIAGVRYSTPGDRARLLAEGTIELLGRDSVTINSGGEKIFAEEVEAAIASHSAVQDVVVAGRPSSQWGQAVVAIVSTVAGSAVTASELIDHAGRSIARYKLPKAVVFCNTVERSPSGKPDYRWAREQAQAVPAS
ncbi:acyl-CoA synthetase [Mycobacterium sp. DL440]|uniref:acyl-CoA synthetase n=1 Tax=Mycobacterium sp. DL440 TaxID=2675523 RepID=UPI00142399A1|nr:acyl-CoA synthetase [Mycobacterium sp. DL440]